MTTIFYEGKRIKLERTAEDRAATKQRKAKVRAAHRKRVMEKYPPNVRWAKAKFKKGKKSH